MSDILSKLVEDVTHQICPLVCQELVFQIGGLAQRAQLDAIAEPLKKLIFNRPMMARESISLALNNSSFPSQRVTSDDKWRWLEKIMK